VGILNGFRRYVVLQALYKQFAGLYSICLDAIFKRSELLGCEYIEVCSCNQ